MNKVNRRANWILSIAAMTALTAAVWSSQASGASNALVHGRHLLLDSRIVATTENAELTLGTVTKHPRNPLFGEDKPWEPRFDNVYASVVYDDGIYKCWYNPFIVDKRTTSTPPDKRNPDDTRYMDPLDRKIGLCYAYSKDGIEWVKPELGLVEFEGSKANNLVMNEPHGVGVFLDEHETDPEKRYKAFFSSFDFGDNKDMTVAFSGDGIHWSEWVNAATIESPGDTHNNAFWDPYTQKYMGYTRSWSDGAGRVVTYTESQDFLTWTKHYEVFGIYDDEGPDYTQAHDMIVFPTGGVYLGLLGSMVFQIPNGDEGERVTQHVELTWSPDGKNWNRIQAGVPFIENSPGPHPATYGKMPYDWGTIFASTPLFLEDETRIYYGACDWYFFDWRKGYLALATIRPDGWAGYEPAAKDESARIETTAVECSGNDLRICADVEENGYVKVRLLDSNGEQLAEGEPVEKTVPYATIEWKGGFSPEDIKGKKARLEFELKKAKLYSFGFDGKA